MSHKMLSESVFFMVTYLLLPTNGMQNNVCPTFEDYYTIRTNPRCWYNFAADSKVPEIIAKTGHPFREYKVQTDDGYILTVYRISNEGFTNGPRKRFPIFLQHGISSTSANWVALGNRSLPFVLANEGYDVWLGNYRGTEYSEEHVNMTVFDQEYWEHTKLNTNFIPSIGGTLNMSTNETGALTPSLISLDDLSLRDLPTMLELVARETRKPGDIIYVGHSLGCSMGLMYGSYFSERSKQLLKMNLMMAPAHILENMISPYRAVAPYADLILSILRSYGAIRIASQAEPTRKVVMQTCLESPELMRLCMQVYNLFYGINTQISPESIPVYFNQIPGGTSVRVLRHAADLLTGFRMYDYGLDKNLKVYGSVIPPTYDVSKIKVPTYIMVAQEDWATTRQDGRNLFAKLSPRARHGFFEVRVPNFNHEDFIFGSNAKALVYDKIVQILDRLATKQT